MRLTVTTVDDASMFNLEVGEEMELENLKALCEMESGISANLIVLVHEGKPLLDDKKELKSYSIKDGDMLLMQKIQQQIPASAANPLLPFDFSAVQIPTASSSSGSRRSSQKKKELEPDQIRQMLLANPEEVAMLRVNNPRLADALNDLDQFTKVLREQQQQRGEEERKRIRMLVADPFDSEAQQMIAEEIRKQQIENNMETAIEHLPESFGQVLMLYVNCIVNGFPIKAFVDSGAQSTIMSKACAERCNIMRLIDTRWSGIAKGVGTQRILGRIHMVQIQIGDNFLASSFTILEDQPMDMLLGLDMLKRHQCCIDLKKNALLIGTTGTEAPFLAEGELPDFARNNRSEESHSVDEDAQLAEALNRSAKDAQSTKVSATSSSQPSQPSSTSFPEADIAQIMALGFNREQVIQELTKFNGDKDQAMAALFAKSFQIPQ